MNFTKIMAVLLLVFMTTSSWAQQQIMSMTKKIEVTGHAEMEVTPDEIYVRITLKEYTDGRKKVDINRLEDRLIKAMRSERIPEENLTVQNIYGYNWDWKKKKSGDFLATKSYRLKVSDLKKMNDLIQRLDERGVNNMNVDNYTHSKLDEYQKELKLKALKNAKEKATFLLAGIDEQIGGVLEVYENPNAHPGQPVMYRAQAMDMAESASYQSNVEFKTIKLTSDIKAVFAIQ